MMSEQTEIPEGRWPIKCDDCGASAEVPFKPDPSRPVYCRSCHNRRRDFAKGKSADRILHATSIIHDPGKPRSGYFAEKETGKE